MKNGNFLKFWILLFLIIPIFVYGAQGQVANNNGAAVAARIKNAEMDFEKIVENSPNKQVDLVAFFSNDMTLESATNIVNGGSNLTIKGFRHGTPFFSGGYTMKNNESLSDAMQQYRRDHIFFLDQSLISVEGMISSTQDKDLRNAFVKKRAEILQREKDFQETGLRVVGVELSGKAIDLKRFRDDNISVRVLEIKDNSKPQPSIMPVQ